MTRTTHPIALTLMACALHSAFAADAPKADDTLAPVVVTATRTEKSLEDLPPAVTTTSRSTLDNQQVNNWRDLGDLEPGVNIVRDPRYGFSSVNIRGLEGNRVLMLVDGIRLPDAFNFGPLLNSGRNSVDFATLSGIDIVRGPGSSLYGSDALGGVVGMNTLEPADLLRGKGKSIAGQVKGDYDSSDSSYGGSAAVAGEAGAGTLWLVQANGRKGHEQDNMGERDVNGPRRTTPNPQDYTQTSALAKLQHNFESGHSLGVTLEAFKSETDTSLLNELGDATLSTPLSSKAQDELNRKRASLQYGYTALQDSLIDRAKVMLYKQDSDARQQTDRIRTPAASKVWNRVSEFSQDTKGINGQLESIVAGDIGQHWVYGAEWFTTDSSELRSGYQCATGCAVPNTSGFPTRDFPNTTTKQWGVFAQNEISFANGKYTLTPGLRYDSYKLDPETDKYYTGLKPVNQDESAWSPKLAASWNVSEGFTLFGQYAYGFRAPAYSELNSGFTNLAFGYATIANPSLKPEKSRGFEFGTRLGGKTLGGSITAYDNRYKDFIEQDAYNCPGNVNCVPGTSTTYQYVNKANVRIYGADAAAFWSFMPGWKATAGIAYAVGRDEDTDKYLDSVSPLKGVFALGYGNETWGAQGRLTAVSAKDKVSTPTYFQAPGYGLVDLTAWWVAAKDLRITGGVYNLGGRKYWVDSDVRGLASTSTVMDRYTQPGRNFRASVNWQF
ncbi:Hemin receptor [Andreprevotia sp. IGB-42]|uniref:TonB-dependent hemoglobin/transferrin/lactoferrin family receptor n=1 Tax=Andreprevotia sp. IGB-42 TaxID=2497473 RepID=UPI00135B8B89|nr:TonB-dependent hemoglobin/transferrin/lactoferrin family receptor [Andreprevotia sp. IGB-42]KAF0814211.1 Hemin receptor [Andreprevotia sp. IGB-42]